MAAGAALIDTLLKLKAVRVNAARPGDVVIAYKYKYCTSSFCACS